MMKNRNQLKAASLASDDPEILKEYRRLRNKISNRLKHEKINYYKMKFPDRYSGWVTKPPGHKSSMPKTPDHPHIIP